MLNYSDHLFLFLSHHPYKNVGKTKCRLNKEDDTYRRKRQGVALLCPILLLEFHEEPQQVCA